MEIAWFFHVVSDDAVTLEGMTTGSGVATGRGTARMTEGGGRSVAPRHRRSPLPEENHRPVCAKRATGRSSHGGAKRARRFFRALRSATLVGMAREQRVPRRLRVRAPCRLQAGADLVGATLVDLSAEGACVDLDRRNLRGTENVFEAWLRDEPLRLHLGGGRSRQAKAVWAQGPRSGDDHDMRIGLRFVTPVRNFGALVRELVD